VREQQVASLKHLRANATAAKVDSALNALTHAPRRAGATCSNCVDAARAKATVGEMSMAMEKVSSGATRPRPRASGRVLGREMGEQGDAVERVRTKPERFEDEEGRRPRLLVAKMGQDGHDRGQKVIATAFADLGFDVDIGPLFQTPEETARQAVENDVHIVGVVSSRRAT
jgi:methylmalonyl-CoA mutase